MTIGDSHPSDSIPIFSFDAPLDAFAYVASHDLKAPLRAIFNLAQWLQDDVGEQISPENQEQIILMQTRVKRLEGFIDG